MPRPKLSVLHHLDRMPKAWAIALGLCLGGLAGFALLAGWPRFGPSVFLGLAGLAAYTAWSGEPIAIPVPVIKPKNEPKPVPVEPPKPEDPLWASIPGGSFSMGSNDRDNEKPIHKVHLSPFHMMKIPVTRKLYQHIIGKDPGLPEGGSAYRPVNNVSWHDAVNFCNRWSVVDGLTPCYQIDGNKVTLIDQADGYRLPTEAEWEYACRAGSTTRWCFGDEEAELPDYAWFDKNADGKPHPVATRKPNAWGLYDMHGNVWEWCGDWYVNSYTELEQTDPLGAAEGSSRVLRGGSFFNTPEGLRSAYRDGDRPVNRGWDVGFRCVRLPRRI